MYSKYAMVLFNSTVTNLFSDLDSSSDTLTPQRVNPDNPLHR